MRSALYEERVEKEEYMVKLRAQVNLTKEKEATIGKLEQEIKAKETKIEEQAQLVDNIQQQTRSFKKTLDDLLEQLATVKAMTTSLKREKDELMYENESLKLRAAAGFDELTPRPHYKKIMEEKRVELGIKTDPYWRGTSLNFFKLNLIKDGDTRGKAKLRTTQVVESLISKYLSVLKLNRTLESQLKRGIIHSEASSPGPQKRNSVILKNKLGFGGKETRGSLLIPQGSPSRFSVKDSPTDSPALRRSPTKVKVSIFKAPDNESSKDEIQSVASAEAIKKSGNVFTFSEQQIEATVPLLRLASLSINTSRSHSSKSIASPGTVNKDASEIAEIEEDEDKKLNESESEPLKIDLLDVTGIAKEGADENDVILQKSDELIQKITETRDGFKQFMQRTPSIMTEEGN